MCRKKLPRKSAFSRRGRNWSRGDLEETRVSSWPPTGRANAGQEFLDEDCLVVSGVAGDGLDDRRGGTARGPCAAWSNLARPMRGGGTGPARRGHNRVEEVFLSSRTCAPPGYLCPPRVNFEAEEFVPGGQSAGRSAPALSAEGDWGRVTAGASPVAVETFFAGSSLRSPSWICAAARASTADSGRYSR